MIKLNWILILLNLLLLILINIFIQFGIFQRGDYDLGANAVVVFCLAVSVYTLRNIYTTKWFGRSVAGDHPSNVTISKIFGFVCLIPALFMNIHPFLNWAVK